MPQIFDIECYRNYCLVIFQDTETAAYTLWDKWNDQALVDYPLQLPQDTLIGFNSRNYDMLILAGMLAGWSNSHLKGLSDQIIKGGLKHWTFERDYGLSFPRADHVDIIEVLPLKASLKLYGARIGSKRLQELPIEPDALIEWDQIGLLREYCLNDCKVTGELYTKVKPQIALREKLGVVYGMDLRSKSDAQIAEAVINGEVELRLGARIQKPSSSEWQGRLVHYTPPPFVKFETPQMQLLLEEIKAIPFEIGANGSVQLPKTLTDRSVEIGGKHYKLGVGGLHSIDGPGSFYASDAVQLADIDVASYYPSIILNAGYYPQHIGPVFLDIYRALVTKRLNAKKRGDKVTDDTLKITINGTFGKLGSKYSKVYAPDLMLHVTLTGQLCLLMLIEALPEEVISANTDGILVQYDQWSEWYVKKIVEDWENFTGFDMEWTAYRSFHRRDVNSYLAIKPDGKIKTKGIFAPSSLMKNPVNEVVIDAVIANLRHGIPVKDTIMNCTDPARFLTLRTVKGGAVKDDKPLGKAIRWYWSKESGSAIHYVTSGDKVPNSDEGVPLMDLPEEMPADIDYRRYIKDAEKLLEQIR